MLVVVKWTFRKSLRFKHFLACGFGGFRALLMDTTCGGVDTTSGWFLWCGSWCHWHRGGRSTRVGPSLRRGLAAARQWFSTQDTFPVQEGAQGTQQHGPVLWLQLAL